MKTALIRICLAVVFRPKTHFVIPASAAFLVFAVPHFFFHIAHPEGTTSGEAIALTAANGIVALLGIAIFSPRSCGTGDYESRTNPPTAPRHTTENTAQAERVTAARRDSRAS